MRRTPSTTINCSAETDQLDKRQARSLTVSSVNIILVFNPSQRSMNVSRGGHYQSPPPYPSTFDEAWVDYPGYAAPASVPSPISPTMGDMVSALQLQGAARLFCVDGMSSRMRRMACPWSIASAVVMEAPAFHSANTTSDDEQIPFRIPICKR